MPETSVVIVNLNGMDHLQTCLGSLFRQSYSDFEVVLVDNGSTDRSVEFVKEQFPAVKVMQLEKNTGFAFATNRGIEYTSTRFVALLNNDIELKDTWLQEMVEALEGHPEVGAGACKMLNFADRSVIDAAGDALTRAAMAEARGHGEMDRGQYDQAGYVFGPCAGAALYRREVFEQVGTFDESFFAFYEDIDLDFRMQSSGWKVLYVPSAVCYHKRGATVRTMQRIAVKLHVRNNIFYLLKNVPSRTILRRLPAFTVARMHVWLAYIRRGHTVGVLLGLAEAMLKLPEMLSKRRTLRMQRKVEVKYIESLMDFAWEEGASGRQGKG